MDKQNQKGTYNSKLVSNLLVAAKGPHRTHAKFCEECGISAPTYSRYVNGKNKKPCPIDLLRKVAEHADPKSDVTFDILIAANEGSELATNDIPTELSDNELIGLMTTAILMSKYQCKYSEETGIVDILGLSYQPSWSISTTAIDGITFKKWDFIFWKQIATDNTEADRFIRQLLIILSATQLGYVNFDKLSFIIYDSTLYQALQERLDNLHLACHISLILVDSDKRILSDEYNIPNNIRNTYISLLSTDKPTLLNNSPLLSGDENNIF